SNGTLNPTLTIKLVWGFLMAGTASVLLLSGGGGLDALQTASIIAALPFGIIMLLMIVSMIIFLRRDYEKNYKPIEISPTIRKRDVSLKEQPGMNHVYDEMTEDLYDKMKEELYDEIKIFKYLPINADSRYDIMKQLYFFMGGHSILRKHGSHFYFIGLITLTLGIALAVQSQLGTSPFDALLVGLYRTFGLSIGSWED